MRVLITLRPVRPGRHNSRLDWLAASVIFLMPSDATHLTSTVCATTNRDAATARQPDLRLTVENICFFRNINNETIQHGTRQSNKTLVDRSTNSSVCKMYIFNVKVHNQTFFKTTSMLACKCSSTLLKVQLNVIVMHSCIYVLMQLVCLGLSAPPAKSQDMQKPKQKHVIQDDERLYCSLAASALLVPSLY